MKRYTPNLLIKYLIKEFSLSLIIFTIIFSSLIIFITYIDEILFFKDKEITDNFFIKTLILSLIKSPTLIINLSPFIFLFSGIFFLNSLYIFKILMAEVDFMKGFESFEALLR